MQEKSTIKQNILQYLDFKGLSKYKFYQDSGITRGVLDQNNGMSEENTARFLAKYKDVNPEWLLTGKGPMIKGNQIQVLHEPAAEYNKKLVPFYDDVETIGGSNLVADQSGVMTPTEWIDAGDWFRDATASIRHYGDSMKEYPSGCILMIKEVKDRKLKAPGMNYCVETSEFRITKRLVRSKQNPNIIIAYSSNEETYSDGMLIHQPIEIPENEIKRLSLVLGYFVREFGSGYVSLQRV